MTFRMLEALSAILLALSSTSAHADSAVAAKNDYGETANWLCWPGRADACALDNSATVIEADGHLAKEAWKRDPDAPVDCFYVYPTVSQDDSLLSDMVPGDGEHEAVKQQVSRMGSKCRIYAPMYRQYTLTALLAGMAGKPLPGGVDPKAPRPTTTYDDVVDAWRYYLAHENKGRGVVLIGHSQGAGLLARLIAAEIDGQPSQERLVVAIVGGTSLPVQPGRDTGLFKHIPLCRAAAQLGCVISFNAFRDSAPPPANSRSGRVGDPGMTAACVNPANLAGGAGALLAYLPASWTPSAWLDGRKVDTEIVSAPGRLSAECVSKDGFSYLEVHVKGEPKDQAALTFGPPVAPEWGLHLIEMNLVMGNLVEIVSDKAKIYLRSREGGRNVRRVGG